jgi:hypothetical protein
VTRLERFGPWVLVLIGATITTVLIAVALASISEAKGIETSTRTEPSKSNTTAEPTVGPAKGVKSNPIAEEPGLRVSSAPVVEVKDTAKKPVVKTEEPQKSAGPQKPSALPRPPSKEPVVEKPQGPTQAEAEAIRIKAIQDQRRAECAEKGGKFYPEVDGGKGSCMYELHPDPQPIPEA